PQGGESEGQYRNPKQFSNVQNLNDRNILFAILKFFVLNIKELGFRICFVLRASDFGFNPW
ncbi:MAG: hypothetical protein WBF29_05895, partial [Syntrophobacteria bacterium]